VLACLLIGIGLGVAGPKVATAEVDGVHLNVTPYVGYPDIATHVNLEQKILLGGRVGLMLGKYFGVEGTYGRMSTNTVEGINPWPGPYPVPPPGGSIDMNFQHLGADVILNIMPSSRLNPYALGGWSEVRFKPDDESITDTKEFNGWEAGGGLKFFVTPKLGIRVEARDVFWHFDAPPAHTEPADDTNHNWIYTAGLQISLGGSADVTDTDSDGVGDKKDMCPDTPLGALVDSNGCPVDGDNDGVPDGMDQCASTPAGAVVDAQGCPKDADKDGVPDGVDKCPNTPTGGLVDAQGCPLDADRDGVADGVDQCANTPVGVSVDEKGCPTDSDSDGVFDGVDQCPNTPQGAKVDKDGCPIEISEKEIEMLDSGKITVRNIYFDTAKADIKPESEAVLNEIGTILIQWPQLVIEVGGHADARGTEEYNLDLSQRRAESVRSWLVTHYPQLDASKFTAKGYGEGQPVASNKTKAGMAQNRRVEFKVLNPEELTKVKERRRLLQKEE
jgi:outer membrane protein OmpA-like peptidoglycan-associated protein